MPDTAMCECGHHWSVHAESKLTAPTAVCHGYTGSVTPGPLREPCQCTGFAQWTGPRDSRTGEPVKPLTLTVDARIKSPEPPPDAAITAALPLAEQFARQLALPEDIDPGEVRAFTVAMLEAAAPALRAQGAAAERARAVADLPDYQRSLVDPIKAVARKQERDRIRQLAVEHNAQCHHTDGTGGNFWDQLDES